MLSPTELAKVVVDRLIVSPIGRQLVSEAEQEVLERRRALTQRIADFHKRHEIAWPPLARAAEAARQKSERADAAARQARDEHQATLNAALNESSLFEHSVAALEAELRTSYPSVLDEFIEELEIMSTALRLSGVYVTTTVNMWGNRVVETDAPIVLERSAVLRAARRTAEEMKLLAVSEADVRSRIADLRADLAQVGAHFDLTARAA